MLFRSWWPAAVLSLLLLCSCARLPRHSLIVSHDPANNPREVMTQANRININAASAAELEALPGVGKVLAERIVAHRERYGAFRRAEHLMMVRGFSDNKFRLIRNLVSVG